MTEEEMIQTIVDFDLEHPLHRPWEKIVADVRSLQDDYDRPAGPARPVSMGGENGIGQSGTDVSTW